MALMARSPSNVILDRISQTQRKALLARMRPVHLPVGTVLSRAGERPKFAHFVTSGIVSVVTFMKNGGGVEVGLVGREGLVEAVQLLGPASAPSTAFVQVEATGLRMSFAELEREAYDSEPVLRRILEFVQRHNFILGQLAACNGLHEIEARLARWLLMVQDRLDNPEFKLTQEFLAQMLGTRRTSVTMAARSLQQSGLIQYRRGHIHILDRDGLRGCACECYPVVHELTGKN
jgi:CRP-like cAMP-binding protein